jgi:hypothetical protein
MLELGALFFCYSDLAIVVVLAMLIDLGLFRFRKRGYSSLLTNEFLSVNRR